MRNSIFTSDILPSKEFNFLNCGYVLNNFWKKEYLFGKQYSVQCEYQISIIIQFHILALKYNNIKNIVHITILGYSVPGEFIVKQWWSNISQGKYLDMVRAFLLTIYLELYADKHFHSYVGHGQYLRFMCKVPILSLSDTIGTDNSRNAFYSTDF